MKEGAQIAELKAGDHFGERALLTAEPTAATVVALERTELMALGKAKFDEALGPLEQILEKERAQRDREAERQKVARAPQSARPDTPSPRSLPSRAARRAPLTRLSAPLTRHSHVVTPSSTRTRPNETRPSADAGG